MTIGMPVAAMAARPSAAQGSGWRPQAGRPPTGPRRTPAASPDAARRRARGARVGPVVVVEHLGLGLGHVDGVDAVVVGVEQELGVDREAGLGEAGDDQLRAGAHQHPTGIQEHHIEAAIGHGSTVGDAGSVAGWSSGGSRVGRSRAALITRRPWAALGLVAGPAAFITGWVVGGARTPGYSPVNDAISRIAAVGCARTGSR